MLKAPALGAGPGRSRGGAPRRGPPQPRPGGDGPPAFAGGPDGLFPEPVALADALTEPVPPVRPDGSSGTDQPPPASPFRHPSRRACLKSGSRPGLNPRRVASGWPIAYDHVGQTRAARRCSRSANAVKRRSGPVRDREPTLTLAELARVVRRVDPAAFVVPGRIVRRAIKHDRELPDGGLPRAAPRGFVHRRPAGGAGGGRPRASWAWKPASRAPPTVILLAAPEADELADRPAGEVLRDFWRRLFHARVHVELERADRRGSSAIRAPRADPAARPVGLRGGPVGPRGRKSTCCPPRDDLAIYVEFAAVYLELRAFDDHLLPALLPGDPRPRRRRHRPGEDVDAEALLAATRLPGSARPSASSPAGRRAGPPDGDRPRPSEAPLGGALPPAPGGPRTPRPGQPRPGGDPQDRGPRGWPARAWPGRRGRWPARRSTSSPAASARPGRRRRRAARVAPGPARPAGTRRAGGSGRAEARLLYDLQKVCVDHEQPFYAVDLIEWITSLGQAPDPPAPARPPRGPDGPPPPGGRAAPGGGPAARRRPGAELSRLLKPAVHRAEARLRDRFRPEIGRALDETGFAARDLPERVAVQKLDEELLDRVVERGFLAMGDLRDALSPEQPEAPRPGRPRRVLPGRPPAPGRPQLARRSTGFIAGGKPTSGRSSGSAPWRSGPGRPAPDPVPGAALRRGVR